MLKAVINAPPSTSTDIRWFYHQYAAMLLGYINGIVQNQQQSEAHLVNIITSFAKEFNVNEANKANLWFQLRQYARNQLSGLILDKAQPAKNDESLDGLSDLEREIFCAVYYQGKSVLDLATTLAKSEAEIRNQLKLSIDKMRRIREN